MANKKLRLIENSLKEIQSQIDNVTNKALLTFSRDDIREYVKKYLEVISLSLSDVYMKLSSLKLSEVNRGDYRILTDEVDNIINNCNDVLWPYIFVKQKIAASDKSDSIFSKSEEIVDKLQTIETEMNNFTAKLNNPELVKRDKKGNIKGKVLAGVAAVGVSASLLMGAKVLETNNKLSSANELVNTLKNDISVLRSDISILQGQKLTLEEEKSQLEEQLKNAGSKEEVERLQALLQDKNEELNVVNGKLTVLNSKYDKLVISYDALKMQNDNLLNKNKEYTSTIKSLETIIDDKNAEISQINTSIELLNGEINGLKTTIGEKESQIKELNDTIQTKDDRIKELEEQLKNAGGSTDTSELEKELKQAQAERDQAKKDLESANEQLADANTTIEELRNTNNSLKSSLETAQAERDDYLAQYIAKSDELSKANSEKETLENENNALKGDKDALANENNALKGENARLTDIILQYSNGELDASARAIAVTFLSNKGVNCSGMSDEEIMYLLIQFAGGDLGKTEESENDFSPSVDEDEENKPTPGYHPDEGPSFEP